METNVVVGPNESWWLGGEDGGVFVKIYDDNNAEDQIYLGEIYNDGDQSLWYKGRFKLLENTDFKPKDKSSYSFWDGERLHLKQGYLQALDPIPPL